MNHECCSWPIPLVWNHWPSLSFSHFFRRCRNTKERHHFRESGTIFTYERPGLSATRGEEQVSIGPSPAADGLVGEMTVRTPKVMVSSLTSPSEPRTNPLSFHYIGCLIGIFIMLLLESLYKWVVFHPRFHPLHIPTNQGPFFHCSSDVDWDPKSLLKFSCGEVFFHAWICFNNDAWKKSNFNNSIPIF